MRRDIQQVLARWGVWASDDNTGVDWSPVAAGFKGLLPQRSTWRLSCSDDDGLLIDNCVLQLQKVRQLEELALIMAYYVKGFSKRAMARKRKCSEMEVRRRMKVAEGFIEGCLSMLDVRLDMDPEVKIFPPRKSEKILSALRTKTVNVI